eukprot:evm.model.scf_573.1 EVM.evm.TU.scf_573.1   scf_573:892-1764(+)
MSSNGASVGPSQNTEQDEHREAFMDGWRTESARPEKSDIMRILDDIDDVRQARVHRLGGTQWVKARRGPNGNHIKVVDGICQRCTSLKEAIMEEWQEEKYRNAEAFEFSQELAEHILEGQNLAGIPEAELESWKTNFQFAVQSTVSDSLRDLMERLRAGHRKYAPRPSALETALTLVTRKIEVSRTKALKAYFDDPRQDINFDDFLAENEQHSVLLEEFRRLSELGKEDNLAGELSPAALQARVNVREVEEDRRKEMSQDHVRLEVRDWLRGGPRVELPQVGESGAERHY